MPRAQKEQVSIPPGHGNLLQLMLRQLRDIAINNLRAHAGVEDSEIEKFKNYCVVLEYFAQPNHCGGLMIPDKAGPERRMLSDGRWFTWINVPLSRIMDCAESWISTDVDAERKTEVWNKLHDNLPWELRAPKWEPRPGKNHYPATQYSTCRAKKSVTNAELIEKFCNQTGNDKDYVAVHIVLQDSLGDDRMSWLTSRGGKPVVVGGRLGRDHTLEDVPHHFVRDQLMSRIERDFPASARRAIEEAVFLDLSGTQLDFYRKLLETLKQKDIEEALKKSEEVQKKSEEAQEKAEQRRNFYRERNQRIVNDLEDAVKSVDCDIDLTAYPEQFAAIDYDPLYALGASCTAPKKPYTSKEMSLPTDEDIVYDCDQIRAMIARLVIYGDWAIDDVRQALGQDRKTLTHFLRRRGIREGVKMKVYPCAWEFFRRRELLGIPLPAKPDSEESVSQEAAISNSKDSKPARKKRKALSEKPANVADNKAMKIAKGAKEVKPEPSKRTRTSKRSK